MAIDSSQASFSTRHGYKAQAKEISIREDAPESLRYVLLSLSRELGLGPHSVRSAICEALQVRPNPDNNSPGYVWREAEDLVYRADWFRVYGFAEKLYRELQQQDLKYEAFEQALNSHFAENGIGWQMADGRIVARGTESFESNVHSAVDALDKAGRKTARDEIHEALGDLSRRPEPDLTGAVQHAMAALECVARDVCGDEKATLGEVIKRYPDIIPKPLDESIAKAWGYASEMARHIREGRKPEHREVELIVGLAATVATYLSR